MSSVFIWKSPAENDSVNYLKYFMGPNWTLEDYPDKSTKSYKLVSQTSLYDSTDNEHILVHNIAYYSNNWCGSNILECMDVPYKLLKVDNYGTFEHIGEWYRVTLNRIINNQYLGKEYNNIKNWILRKAHNGTKNHTAQIDNITPVKPIVNSIKKDLHKTTLIKSIPLTNCANNLSYNNTKSHKNSINNNKYCSKNDDTHKRKYNHKQINKHVKHNKNGKFLENMENSSCTDYPPCMIQFNHE